MLEINNSQLNEVNQGLVLHFSKLEKQLIDEKNATYEMATAFNKLAELSAINDNDNNIKCTNNIQYEKEMNKRYTRYKLTIAILGVVSIGSFIGWMKSGK